MERASELGELVVAPTIVAHGTEAQRAALLPGIRSRADVYCLGFSEPGHGSDLASVETRGRVAGGDLVVTGRKVWVAGIERANAMLVLCRTNPDVPAHLGLSCVALRLDRGGAGTRLVRTMAGAGSLGDVTLDGVRAPLAAVVGGIDGGWAPAMTALRHLRAAGADVGHVAFEVEFWDLVREAERSGVADEPHVRSRLAWAYSRIAALRLLALRGGPEPAVRALLAAEYHRRFGEIAMDVAGASGMVRPDGPDYPTSRWQEVFLSSRADTVRHGTSEVLRDVIAERVLALPREPGAVLPVLPRDVEAARPAARAAGSR